MSEKAPQHLIERPEKFLFSTDYRVQSSDIQLGNHLGAGRVLPISIETQLKFFESLGYSWDNIEGCSLIMVNSQTDFLREVLYPARLQIDLAISEMGSKHIDMIYCFSNEKQRETARVKTRSLFYNYSLKSIQSVPSAFLEKLSQR